MGDSRHAVRANFFVPSGATQNAESGARLSQTADDTSNASATAKIRRSRLGWLGRLGCHVRLFRLEFRATAKVPHPHRRQMQGRASWPQAWHLRRASEDWQQGRITCCPSCSCFIENVGPVLPLLLRCQLSPTAVWPHRGHSATARWERARTRWFSRTLRPLRIPEIAIEGIEVRHLAAPLPVRVARLLRPLSAATISRSMPAPALHR